MTTDILNHLRRLTKEAQREVEEQAQREKEEAEATAKEIINDIVSIAEAEAKKGKTFASIMDVTFCGRPTLFEEQTFSLSPKLLVGASRIVWDHCKEEGLEPMLVGRWTELTESLHRVDFSLVIQW